MGREYVRSGSKVPEKSKTSKEAVIERVQEALEARGYAKAEAEQMIRRIQANNAVEVSEQKTICVKCERDYWSARALNGVRRDAERQAWRAKHTKLTIEAIQADLEIDDPVLVGNFVNNLREHPFERHYFAGWCHDGRILTWGYGTSWSCRSGNTTPWEYWTLPHLNEGGR